MSYKRSIHHQQDEPWLRYPDPHRTHSHSRAFSPTPHQKHLSSASIDHHRHDHQDHHRYQLQSQPQPQLHPHSSSHPHLPPHHPLNSTRPDTPPVLRHKKSSARLHASSAHSSSSASSSTSSLGYQLQQAQRSEGPTDRQERPVPVGPRTLSEELTLAFHQAEANYQSPLTPSDLLMSSPMDVSSVSGSSSASSPTPPSHFPLARSSSTSHRLRPSPLSINTNLNGPSTLFPETSPLDLATPPLPRLTRGSSTASNSSYSNTSSPSSTTAPCSSLCHHQHGHHHPHHHSKHSSHRHHRHTHHHPSCQVHGEEHSRPSSRQRRHAKGLHRAHFDEKMGSETASETQEGPVEPTTPTMPPMALTAADPSMALTLANTTTASAYGVGALKEQRDQADAALSLYATEPPKKRQRSAASFLLGAAVETVIFTGAVALSAYQLLTGKGKQAAAAKDNIPEIEVENPAVSNATLQIEGPSARSAPRDIRTKNHHGSSPIAMARSLKTPHHPRHHHHPHHRSKGGRSSRPRHGSMPLEGMMAHSFDETLLVRPNTGTEDSDEAFLRMEAQIGSLIAEGKRALNSRIADWDGM